MLRARHDASRFAARPSDRGRPWGPGTGFYFSAPSSAIRPASALGDRDAGRIWFKVNGDIKQNSDPRVLIWPVPDSIAYLSQLYTLKPGDLICTGTPVGVGSVQRGGRLSGGDDGLDELSINIAD
jgi:fumarylpyruvate hydrolase